MKINDILSDDDIYECIDGHSDIKMIREVIDMTQEENLVDEESFADVFSFNIRGFIDEEIDSDEYDDAYTNYRDWEEQLQRTLTACWLTNGLDCN